MMKTRESVAWFAERMEKKLLANDGKNGWLQCDKTYLTKRLHDELREMINRAKDIGWSNFNHMPIADRDIEELVDECADIANFAMMIADKARYFQNAGKLAGKLRE